MTPKRHRHPTTRCRTPEPRELKVDGETWGGRIISVSASGEYLLGDGDLILWGPGGKTTRVDETVDKKLKRDVRGKAVNSDGTVVGETIAKNGKVGGAHAPI